MKFKSTPYHNNLLKDKERLAIFYEAISTFNNKNLAYDLGCGCGILSYFANPYFKKIIAIEKDSKVFNHAKENLTPFSNIEVINLDVLDYNFNQEADLIICEMLDTALIDEEQVPILNYTHKFLKKNGKIIPESIINFAHLVNMQIDNFHYDDGDSFTKYEILSNNVKYSEFSFYNEINPNFEAIISFKIISKGTINGLMLTTITKLTEDIVIGPTSMLNPPLLIPIEKINVNVNDLINIKLKYIMGEGIESIETSIVR